MILSSLLAVLIVLALYVASAGLTFAWMYRWPMFFDGLVLSRIYSPLEFIAQRCRPFGRTYTRFLNWCYWTFAPWQGTDVWDRIKAGEPPPSTRPPYPPP